MQTMRLSASGLVLVWLMCGCWAQGPPPSPCPDVFSYHYDRSEGWYGVVTILSPSTFSEARLVVKLTVTNYDFSKGYGRIDVLGGNPEIQEISKSAYNGRRHKIQFKVIFPPLQNPPRVQEVLVNEVMFCADHRDYGAVGKIKLNYALHTGLEAPPVSGNEFSVVPSRGHQGHHSGTNAIFQPKDKVHPTLTAPQGSYGSERPHSPDTNGGLWVYYPGSSETKPFTQVQQDGHTLNGNGNANVHYPGTPAVTHTQYPVNSVGGGGYNNGQAGVTQQTKPFTSHNDAAVQHASHISNGNSNTNAQNSVQYSTIAPTLNNVHHSVGSVGGANNNSQEGSKPSSSEDERNEHDDDTSQTEKQKKKVVFRFESFEDDVVKHATFEVGNRNGSSRNFTIHFEENKR